MKKIYYLVLLFALNIFSCLNKQSSNLENISITSNKDRSDLNKQSNMLVDSIWINDFIQFRKALYQDNFEEISNFVEFPLKSSTWILVNPDSISWGVDKEFNKNDFKKNYKKIFYKEFVLSLLSIKSKDLYISDRVISSKPLIMVDTFRAFVCHENFSRNFIIGISQKKPNHVLFDGSEPDCNHFNVMHYFEIDSNSHLKFKGVNFAG